MKAITKKYEGENSTSSFEKLPEEYVQRLVKAIVGFEIEVISLENVFKLSQNQDETSRRNIAAHLRQKGDDHSKAIAKEMELRFGEEMVE